MWRDWCVMALLMLTPVVIAFGVKNGRRPTRVLVDLAAAFSVWAIAGVVVEQVDSLVAPLSNVAAAVLLACVAGLQFTRFHQSAVDMCAAKSGTRSTNGLRLGAACFAACGPLMVALMFSGVHTLAVMTVMMTLMVAEFVSPWKLYVTRGLGAALGVLAASVLFLGYVPGPQSVMHMQHAHHVS